MAERREAERRAAAASASPDATAGSGSAATPGAAADSVAGGAGGGGGEPRVLRGDLPPKRNVLTKAAIGLFALLGLATAALTQQPKPPKIEPDCVKPAFALAPVAKQNRPFAWTMVGSPDRRYRLALDTATFVEEGGAWHPVPLTGAPRDQVVFVADKPMKDCFRTGVLNLPVPLGRHTVTMFELVPSGAVEVQRETIEVVNPDELDTIQRP